MLRRIQDFFRRGPAVAVVEVIQPQPANPPPPPTQSKCSLSCVLWIILAVFVAVVTIVLNLIALLIALVVLFLYGIAIILQYTFWQCCFDPEASQKIKIARKNLKNKKKNIRKGFELKYLKGNCNLPMIPRDSSDEFVEDLLRTITDLSFQELRGALQNGTYNAYIVMVAYMRKALDIDDQLNCCTDVMLNALTDAISLDANQGTNRDQFPLYGIPFSVKSVFDIANLENNIGLTKRSGVHMQNTSSLVTHLRNLGAIPFCTTNVPQGLLAFVTANPIYGITKNPWDYTRTPGGSSGGEGALIAAGGAPFGIGNDLVGSLRIPAAFCGLVSLKPSEKRLKATHSYCGPENRGLVGASNGFITKKVEDQQYLLSLFIDDPGYLAVLPQNMQPASEEPARVPAPLDPNFNLPQTIRIGYMLDDGFNSVCPSNHRAIEDTIVKLEATTHYELVPFRIQDILIDVPHNNNQERCDVYEVADMLFRNVLTDNGASMRELYNNEPWHSCLRVFILFIWLKNVLPESVFHCFTYFIPSKVLRKVARATNHNVQAYEHNTGRTQTFRTSWERYWTGLNISALICPSFISPAPPHYYPSFLTAGVFSTGLYNMLDCPAGIVPVSHVTEEDVKRMSDYPEKYQKDLSLWLQRESAYESVGLPNAVQVVTLPNQEDTCLKVMRDVQNVSEGCVLKLVFPKNATGQDEAPNTPFLGHANVETLKTRRRHFVNLWYRLPPEAPGVPPEAFRLIGGYTVISVFFTITACMWSWYLYIFGMWNNRSERHWIHQVDQCIRKCCCCKCRPASSSSQKTFTRLRTP